jgi:hypothetical protein
MNKVIYRNAQWHFTDTEVRTNNLRYSIDCKDINDADWIDHLAGKSWCNILDAIDIIIRARHYYEYGRLPQNLAVHADYLSQFLPTHHEKKPN